MNRRRVATISVAALFAAAVVGFAVVATRRDGSGTRATSALAKLPIGAPADAAVGGSMGLAQPVSPVQYVVKGSLPALPSAAPAYAVSGSATEADATRLAGAIGLSGHPVHTGSAFVVVDGNRRLVVPTQASDGWMFSDQAGNADCPPDAECSVASSGTVTAVAPCPAPTCPPGKLCAATSCAGGPPPARPAGTPTKEDAEQVGRAFLAKVGVDVSQAKIRTNDLFDAWAVVADPAVDGRPVLGYSASVTVGANGVVTEASGHLGRLDKTGNYPLAGTDIGLARLKAGPYGSFGGPRPMMGASPASATGVATSAVEGAAAGGVSAPADSPGVSAAPAQPGSPAPQPGPCAATTNATCAVPPTNPGNGSEPPSPPPPMPVPDPIAITGVHLALEFVPSFTAGRPAMLEPAYVFETADGHDLPPVPAVIDALLEEPTAPPPPSPVPCEKPSGVPAQTPPGQAAPDICVGKAVPASPAP